MLGHGHSLVAVGGSGDGQDVLVGEIEARRQGDKGARADAAQGRVMAHFEDICGGADSQSLLRLNSARRGGLI
jgi:hypothetical protein